MNSVAQVEALVAARRGGWVPRGLLGPTSDQLTRVTAGAGWRFVEVTVHGARDKKTLMRLLAEQLALDETFGANWDAFADALWDVATDQAGAILRLKGLADIPGALAEPFVEILDDRTRQGPAPFLIVADPPLPACASDVTATVRLAPGPPLG